MDPNSQLLNPVEQKTDEKSIWQFKRRQYFTAICVCLGSVCAGNCLAWSSPVLPQLMAQQTSSQIDNNSTGNSLATSSAFTITANEAGLIGGMLPGGALFAAIPAGYICDRFGRKAIFYTVACFYLFNWLLIILAHNPLMVIAGRFFSGAATGAVCVATPMYIGEIAWMQMRGTLGAFFQIFLCIGLVLTCTLGAITMNWLVLSMYLACVPVVFLLALLFIPESPVYLLSIGDVEAARKAMQFFGIDDKSLQKDIISRKHHLTKTNESWTIVSNNRRSLISMMVIMMIQQLSGINAVVFYTVPIFQMVNAEFLPDLAGIIIALVQLIASYVALLIMDRAPRKFYLLLSSTGMMMGVCMLAIYLHLRHSGYIASSPSDLMTTYTSSIISYVPLISVVLFMVSFSLGYGSIPWILMGELFSPAIKGVCSGLTILTNWLFAFLVTLFFPIVGDSFGWYTPFYVFSSCLLVGGVFVHCYVPETKGKSLDEIQQQVKANKY